MSGGQKTRALLARLILQQPDVLLLDEPTNHLDVSAVEWLEATLKEYAGSIIIVSHDRYFIDAMADTVWEMQSGHSRRFAATTPTISFSVKNATSAN